MDDPIDTLKDAVGSIGDFVAGIVNELAEATGLSLPVLSLLAIFLAFLFVGMTANIRS